MHATNVDIMNLILSTSNHSIYACFRQEEKQKTHLNQIRLFQITQNSSWIDPFNRSLMSTKEMNLIRFNRDPNTSQHNPKSTQKRSPSSLWSRMLSVGDKSTILAKLHTLVDTQSVAPLPGEHSIILS